MRTLSRPVAFWLLAATLALLLFASSAPSALYVVWQAEWGFSSATLTGVFAVYAIALLGALLTAGSISDHIGRRPTLFAALALEVVAMIAFAAADGVAWLFAARILQGVATGVAMGCISAALIDLQPKGHAWMGALTGAVAPMAGLATGALVAGMLEEWTGASTGVVFIALGVVFVAAVAAVVALPETVERTRGGLASLRPKVSVPDHVRAPFVAALPTIVATWALGGLVLSLAPSLAASVLGVQSHVTAALPILFLAGLSAVAAVVIRTATPQRTAQGGLTALIAGVALVLAGVAAGSLALFLLGSMVAGLGFGPSFAGVFRSLTELAPPERRAELASSVLSSAYLAFSIPALIAGVAATQVGLQETAEVYGGVLIAVAAVALALSGRLGESRSAPAPAESVAA